MGVLVLPSGSRGAPPAGTRLGLGCGLLLALVLAGCGTVVGDRGNVLAGQVVREDGVGLGGTSVYVYASHGEEPVAEATTDASGRFRIELAEPGRVDVRAGRALEDRIDADRTFWHTLTAEALAVMPTDGPVRLVARPGSCEGTVRVRVSSAEGRVSSVQVRAVPTLWPRDAQWWWTGSHTNDVGRVDLDELPRVPVALRVDREPPWCPTRGPVVLPDPRGIDLHRIVVERERILAGRVVDGRGEPVVGCGVMVTSSRDTDSRPWGDLTGADGAFDVGVPESWDDAVLLVGCEEPTETSVHRVAVPILTRTPAAIEVRVEADAVVVPAAAADAEDEARRVMEAVLEAHYLGGDRRDCVVLARELEGMAKAGEAIRYLKEGVDESALRDLAQKAPSQAVLPAGLDVGIRQVVLSDAWWRYLQGAHGWRVWKHFRRRFPRGGGLIWLSHVGFSDDGAQAVMHVAHMRGPRNGDGHYYLLEKRDGGWHVVRRAMTWIS